MFASFCDANMGTACTTSQLRVTRFFIKPETETRDQLPRAFLYPGYRAKNAREPGAPRGDRSASRNVRPTLTGVLELSPRHATPVCLYAFPGVYL